MKSSELKVLIREIVREEVRMELRKYLKEYKTKKVRESIDIKRKPKKPSGEFRRKKGGGKGKKK